MDIGGDNGVSSKGIDGDSSEFSSRERIIQSSKRRVSNESSPKGRKQVLSTGTR